jgi:hypothetical protein
VPSGRHLLEALVLGVVEEIVQVTSAADPSSCGARREFVTGKRGIERLVGVA